MLRHQCVEKPLIYIKQGNLKMLISIAITLSKKNLYDEGCQLIFLTKLIHAHYDNYYFVP